MAKFGITDHTLLDASQLRRAAMLALIYASIIGASFYLAYEIRFDFLVPEDYQQNRLRLLTFVIGIKLLALVVARQLGSLGNGRRPVQRRVGGSRG